MRIPNKLAWVALYAAAMAYVESAGVVYLRRIYGIQDLVTDVAPYDPVLAPIEVGREAATLIMLLAVGWAAGRTRQARLGFAFFAFGLWDIFYYLWLRILIGWPGSLADPDILFLIPLPWWGPVLSPVLIACLAAAGGALAVLADEHGRAVRPRVIEWISVGSGALAVLYAFMADAISALPAGPEALARLRPTSFNWTLYLVGLALMAGSVGRAAWRAFAQRNGELR